jgi:uracil-DNA glycosylase
VDEDALNTLCAQARACRVCESHLPLPPRPVFRVSATARVLIIAQAPGTKAHETGLPFNDASGDRLRGWMGVDRETFYDSSRVAFLPMGFCYPGRLPTGGDAPPRPECAPLWHDKFFTLIPNIRIKLLVGGYALRRYLGKGTMTEHVRNTGRKGIVALPHPSWRTTAWEARNTWFAQDVLPALRAALALYL